MKTIYYAFRNGGSFQNPENEHAWNNLPDDFLFGYRHLQLGGALQKRAFNLRRGKRDTFLRICLGFFEKPFSRAVKLGFPLEIYFECRNELKAANLIFCTYETIAFPLLLLKKLGLVKSKLVIMVQSLPEREKYFRWFFPFPQFIRWLLTAGDQYLTLSLVAKEGLYERFKIPQSIIEFVPFGVDTDFWTPDNSILKKKLILTIGNDFNRDYKTLSEATKDPAFQEYEIAAITELKLNASHIQKYSNLTFEEVRQKYREAMVVVIPSRYVYYESSGLSTTLQAMACGATVLVSESKALDDYLNPGINSLNFEPENSADLRKKLIQLIQSPDQLTSIQLSARKHVEAAFTSKHIATKLKGLFVGLLEGK